MPKRLPPSPPSKLKDRLTESALALQEFAQMMAWAVSKKNYIPFELYQDLQQKEALKEQRERIRELKRRKWIEIKKIGEHLYGRLTDQGWRRALRDRVRGETKRCEGGVCIIIFDIPEKLRHIRKVLRLFLKEAGFKKLQHSVWMTDKDVIEPLMLLLQRQKLERWVRIVHGTVLPLRRFDAIRAVTSKATKPKKRGADRKGLQS